MRTIALEEHLVSPNFASGPGRQFMERLRGSGPRGPRICEQLQELWDARIIEMDAAGTRHPSPLAQFAWGGAGGCGRTIAIARDANDFLAEAIKKHPTRLAAFAVLPVASPSGPPRSWSAGCAQLGFKGTLINGHTRGRYLDDKFFWPILERAVALNVPLYLHPTMPPRQSSKRRTAGFLRR